MGCVTFFELLFIHWCSSGVINSFLCEFRASESTSYVYNHSILTSILHTLKTFIFHFFEDACVYRKIHQIKLDCCSLCDYHPPIKWTNSEGEQNTVKNVCTDAQHYFYKYLNQFFIEDENGSLAVTKSPLNSNGIECDLKITTIERQREKEK